jgi:hypothetical protein
MDPGQSLQQFRPGRIVADLGEQSHRVGSARYGGSVLGARMVYRHEVG